ncbi:MAG: hypothetical protein ACTH8P_10290, partial [Ewingella sp.]|uniref:hypothetical protein n=1 Tax=Ewingella sp. TaxID=1897459 RepID=UPI003F8E4046
ILRPAVSVSWVDSPQNTFFYSLWVAFAFPAPRSKSSRLRRTTTASFSKGQWQTDDSVCHIFSAYTYDY